MYWLWLQGIKIMWYIKASELSARGKHFSLLTASHHTRRFDSIWRISLTSTFLIYWQYTPCLNIIKLPLLDANIWTSIPGCNYSQLGSNLARISGTIATPYGNRYLDTSTQIVELPLLARDILPTLTSAWYTPRLSVRMHVYIVSYLPIG